MGSDQPQRSQEGDEIQIIDLDRNNEETSSVAPGLPVTPFLRLSPRQRGMRLVATVGVVTIVLLILIGNTVSLPNVVKRFVFGPLPSPTVPLLPGQNQFYVQGDPTWGKLFVDGRAVAHLSAIGVGSPLRLARGQHTLLWRAAPFRDQQCTVSVPLEQTDTCRFGGSVESNAVSFAWVVYFNATLETLPPQQRGALLQTVQQVLNGQGMEETVRLGEVYADALMDRPVTAIKPLNATLSFVVNTSSSSHVSCVMFGQMGQPCAELGQDCHQWCSVAQSELSNDAVLGWSVFVVVQAAWTFATPNGQVVERTEQDGYDNIAASQHLLPLRITWSHEGWRVVIPDQAHFPVPIDSNITCATARDEVQTSSMFNNAQVEGAPPTWQYVTGRVPAQGCLAIGVPYTIATITGVISSSTLSTVALCLYRFGVYLAANAVAHRLWPSMPTADAYEQGIAQRLFAALRS